MTPNRSTRDVMGPVRQVGYIVAEVEAAAADWVERLGIGPWRIKRGVVLEQCLYLGSAIEVEVSIASSYSDGLEVELVSQSGGARSMYSDFLRTRGPGVQHVCFYPADYDAARAHLIGSGLAPVLEAAIGGTRFAYLGDDNGLVIEIADVSALGLTARAERAGVAESWTGEQPRRF